MVVDLARPSVDTKYYHTLEAMDINLAGSDKSLFWYQTTLNKNFKGSYMLIKINDKKILLNQRHKHVEIITSDVLTLKIRY